MRSAVLLPGLLAASWLGSPLEGLAQSVTVTGELRPWRKVTLSLAGPVASESGTPNPFSDLRMVVRFTHPASGLTYRVPGYFAADGRAADSSATSGNQWRAHLCPDHAGEWSYAISFRSGTRVAIDPSEAAGTAVVPYDGLTGSFTIGPGDPAGSDPRDRGRLQYVQRHHLQFTGGRYFLKVGADSPENLLAYDDFDGTPNAGGRRKTWGPHAADYAAAEAAAHTWAGGKGTELLGALSYLAAKGMNAFSFLTFNLDGDDDNVFPHLLTGTVAAFESAADNQRWGAQVFHERFDVSKLDQWERVFEYADRLGLYLHFKTQETENDQKMDGGALGPERQLYYRELVARFAHHLALNWNLGEENSNTDTERKAFAQWFHDQDPYRHPVVVHTFPGSKDAVYAPMLGAASRLAGASLQSDPAAVFADTRAWVSNSAASGRPWVVANDEQGGANTGIKPDADDAAHDAARRDVLWGNLMAGGAGIESYFGYSFAHSDLTCVDFRSRDRWWDQCRHAARFFEDHAVPYWDLANRDVLVNAGHCLAGADHYVVYLPAGGAVTLNLAGAVGDYRVRWYDPRAGGALQTGSVARVTGGSLRDLGAAPGSPTRDWVILLARDPDSSGTTHVYAPVEDAYLENTTPYNNTTLKVQPASPARVSYLKFSVTHLAAGAVVEQATLSLTEGGDPGNGTLRAFRGAHHLWTETTLTSANAPAAQEEVARWTGALASGQSLALDLTAFVRSNGTYTLVLTLDTGGNDLWFSSKEGPAGPRLTLTSRIPVPLRLEAGPPADGLFTVRVTGPDGASVALEATSNLTGWVAIHTNELRGGSLVYPVPLPAGAGEAFYRARGLIDPPAQPAGVTR